MITNDTLRFVLPIFYNASLKLNADFFLNDYFEGAFTSDFNHPELDDKLILAYNYFPTEEYIEFENKLRVLLNPIVEYYNEESDTITYVIEIPDEYLDDYSLIAAKIFKGLSPVMKLKIIKMWGLNDEDNLFKVLVGDKEYDGKPFEDEILNFKQEENVTTL